MTIASIGLVSGNPSPFQGLVSRDSTSTSSVAVNLRQSIDSSQPDIPETLRPVDAAARVESQIDSAQQLSDPKSSDLSRATGDESVLDSSSEDVSSEDALVEQQELEEQLVIRELAARDREVRAHEQAHAAVGGVYAGAPTYQFERGPDGVSYAVAGEVSIDVSPESTPEETISKLQTVIAAALAPAEPSAQDRAVAAQAAASLSQAQAEVRAESAEESGSGPDAEPNSLDGLQGNRAEAENSLVDESGSPNSSFTDLFISVSESSQSGGRQGVSVDAFA